LAATATPAPTTGTPSPSPQAVAGAIQGPSGVPATGSGDTGQDDATAQLLIIFGVLFAALGTLAILGSPGRREQE
jgi:hypothetical protein